MKKYEKRDGQPLKSLIGEMIQKYELEDRFSEARVVTLWRKLMGKPIVDRTRSVYVKDHKLFVEVISAPLRDELNFAKSKIKDMINKDLGEEYIKEVIVR